MARPTSLTEQRIRQMEEAAKLGMKREHIAKSGGIAAGTFYSWMARGRRGEEPHKEFYERLEKAIAIGIQNNLVIIRNEALKGNWQAAAWILERCHKYIKGVPDLDETDFIDTEEVDVKQLLQQIKQSNDELKQFLEPEIED
jgi:transposase